MKKPKTSMKQAVALKYSPQDMQAPAVVAKGKGLVAEEILQKAKEHGVPIQEDSSLVEILGQLELNQEIPAELYQLVAEILNFVYRTDSRARGGRA